MFKVGAVSDPNSERRAEAENEVGCRSYSTFEELIGDPEIDVVVVATPSTLHCQQTVTALEAGKNVVCEKPMAVSLEQADQMIEASKRTGKLLTVFQNNRYSPDFLKVREILDSGVLGRIVQIRSCWSNFARRWDWQTLRKFGGGNLNNTGPHPLDQLLLLFGDHEPEIFVHMERALTLGDAEDHVKLILQAPGAPTIDLEVSSVDPFGSPRWHILGTKGGLQGDAFKLKWKYFDPADLPERTVSEEPTPDRSYNREEIPWKEDNWERPEDGESISVCFYKHLYNALQSGGDPDISPEHSRRMMALIEECHRRTGI